MSSIADPPEKRHKTANSFLLHAISKYVLIDYSKGLLENVNQLSEENKNQLIDKSANGTIAIILYEFASGMGPSGRYFNDAHPYVHEFRTGPAMQWLMYTFLKSGSNHMPNLRYQFSPRFRPINLNQWSFSIKQHVRTLSSHNLSQFILGSFNAEVTRHQSFVYIHIWNQTSRKSLFLGLGKRLQRPSPLGTTRQDVYMVLTLEEARILASTSKN